MTPEEQTVYAEMGVSPLVLTGQTHLQDVVVEVRLPEEVAAMKAEAPSEPAVSETETPPPEPTPAPATSAVATETATPETPPVTDTRRRRRRSTTLTLAESPTASE